MYKLVIVFVCAMLLPACSSAPYYGSTNSSVKVAEIRIDLSDTHKVKQILDQQYKDWRHVQHRMGGLSKNGIDCSGLVYQTYRAKLGINLPRSSKDQSKIGRAIQQQELRT